jgi:heavy metal sensor kinase
MFESVRVRLTLWYTGALVLVLVVLSFATYFMFRRTMAQRVDGSLVEIGDAFLTTLRAELRDEAGPASFANAAQEAMIEHRFRDQLYAILDSKGKIVLASSDLPVGSSDRGPSPSDLEASPSFHALVDSAANGEIAFQNVRGRRGGYRGYAKQFQASGEKYTLVVLQSRHPQEELLAEISATFLWVIPLTALLASAGGYFLARKSLAPVVGMSTQAGRISAANLHDRLPVKNEKDELGQLASSFNDLLDRLDESFERQRRFMSDASHELRTPVAILRGEAEVALSRDERSVEEYRESLKVLHGEARRLTHIVEDLFTLTRADAGQYPISAHDFYLDELVADCVHSTRTLALAKSISLTSKAAGECPIHADESLLRRMILNLIDNAVKYTPKSGSVTVSCRQEGTEYAIGISDTGPGIAPELQPKIFERFFRADKARSRSESDGGGAGLGLSIARWIAEAHYGRLELTQSGPGGTTFTAYLPPQSKQ